LGVVGPRLGGGPPTVDGLDAPLVDDLPQGAADADLNLVVDGLGDLPDELLDLSHGDNLLRRWINHNWD
jgi:hypothetical protein